MCHQLVLIVAAFFLLANQHCHGFINASDSRDLVIVETFHEETFSFHNIGDNVPDSSCIVETNLDMANLVMAPGRYFKNKTFAECLQFCSENHSNYTHILISYHKAIVMGSEFNCMCAVSEAMRNSTEADISKCNVKCPQSDYRCGDAKNGYLSVYCLHKSCSSSGSTPICANKLPHDSHGCIRGNFIDWNYAHNVRNFTATGGTEEDCTWECKDNHPRSMYSLTRRSGEVLTCSCGYGRSLDAQHLVETQFCKMIDKSPYFYQVNCVDDLNQNNGPVVNSTSRCDKSIAVGCIFDDILAKLNSRKFAISSNSVAVDVTSCVGGCAVMFPHDSYFSAVRMDHIRNELVCFCLGSGSFNLSMLGPDAICSQNCGPIGSGLFCGSVDQHHASSLYCIPEKVMDSSSFRASMNFESPLPIYSDTSLVNGYLKRIDNAVDYGNFTTEIVITLLVLLALIMLFIVIYIWKSRGVSSLSRQLL